MLTLERVKKRSQTIEVGTTLICYDEYYGFMIGNDYVITGVDNNTYSVRNDYNVEIVFTSEKELKEIFMIEN